MDLLLPSTRARLDRLQDPAVALTPDHRILASNQAYRDRYGEVPNPGRSLCHHVSHGYDRPCELEGETCPVRAALATGRPSRVTHVHRHGDHLEHCDIELQPVADAHGEVVQFIEIMRPTGRPRPRRAGMVGTGPAMARTFALLDAAAPTDVPVLLVGETGTGKELAAQALHEGSARHAGPLVAVECPGIAESLFESELFGHERGAFTGADRRREGLVHAARGGTLFLDEIGDLSASMQVKLLRLLEAGTYRRVGSTEPLQADFRLVAATHRDLEDQVRDGTFRQDLYYRLSAFPIRLPPLRERLEDLPALVAHLLPGRHLTPAALDHLATWSWPGNVRELRNVLDRAAILSRGGPIAPSHLPGFEARAPARLRTGGTWPWGDDIRPVAEVERRYVAWAASRPGLTRREVAEKLGLSERQLYRRLR